MVEQIRLLGINPTLKGIAIMEQFVYKTKHPNDLTAKERQEVLKAWDSRYFYSVSENEKEYADHVQPEEGLEGEEYEKRYVELIYFYLQTIK